MLFTLFGQPVTYANWASTQPSSVSETCVTIYGSSGIYYDTDCGSRHYGVCSSIPNFSGFHETGVLGVYIMYYINQIQCKLWKLLQRWRSGLERSPRKRKVGCSNPNRDRPKSLKQVMTAKLPNARHQGECHGSSKITIINRCPVLQQV